jgi:hypothetical protein
MKKAIFFFIFILPAFSCSNSKMDENVQIPRELINKITSDPSEDPNFVYDSKTEFLTYVFTGIGLCQANMDKGKGYENNDLIEQCISKSLGTEAKLFDSIAWDEDPIKALPGESQNHHAGYLGYLNVLLSMYRYISPANKYSGLNDKISIKFMNLLSKKELMQTYPGQIFTPDMAAAVGSVALYFKATNKKGEALANGDQHLVSITANSYGLYNYLVDPVSLESETIRGSSSAVTAYFLSFLENGRAKSLYDSILVHLSDTVQGVFGIREFLRENQPDELYYYEPTSGVVLRGIGSVASGFTMALARIYGDEETYRELDKSARKAKKIIENFVPYTNSESLLEEAVLYAIRTARKIPLK